MSLEVIYEQAKRYVDKWFPSLAEDVNGYRITLLSVMKMLVELRKLEAGEVELPKPRKTEVTIEKDFLDMLSDEEKKLLTWTTSENVDIVSPSGWLGKEKWIEVNNKLKSVGFEWNVGKDKKGRWIRKKKEA